MSRSSAPSCCVTWLALLVAGTLAEAEGPYQPTWESLQKHQTPGWFLDAKFGCWACWSPGVVVTDKVDFQAEWFGRQMYQESQRTGIIDDLDKNEAYRTSGHDLDGSQAN